MAQPQDQLDNVKAQLEALKSSDLSGEEKKKAGRRLRKQRRELERKLGVYEPRASSGGDEDGGERKSRKSRREGRSNNPYGTLQNLPQDVIDNFREEVEAIVQKKLPYESKSKAGYGFSLSIAWEHQRNNNLTTEQLVDLMLQKYRERWDGREPEYYTIWPRGNHWVLAIGPIDLIRPAE